MTPGFCFSTSCEGLETLRRAYRTITNMNKVANKFQEQIAHKVQQGTSMIKYLVEQGADVNARDWYKATPLHLACRRGSRRIVRELLECPGIDPHVTESFSLNNPIEFD